MGVRPSVRLPRRMVASCVSEPTGTAEAAFDRFHAGDERGGHGADAGNQDA